MEIITGFKGYGHITAQQDGALNALTARTGDKVVIKNLGGGLEAEILTATSIAISSGYALNQGRLMGIDILDSETVNITAGSAGAKRVDIIAIRYTKDSETGYEDAQLVVIEGTSGASYVDPEYNNNNIFEGALIDDLPLYRVKINGITIEAIESMHKRWYLDTGWREDLVTTTLEEHISGSDSRPAIRVIGNQVFFRSGYKLATSTATGNYVIPSEYAPSNDMHWTTCEYKTIYDSQGGSAINKQLRFINHSMVDNVIYVEANFYGGTGEGYVELWTTDSTNIYWFID